VIEPYLHIVLGILVTLVFSAFFSGMEIAFVSSNRLLVEMDKEKNGLAQRCLSQFYDHPNVFVSTMLVGNNIVLVVYGILFAFLFDNTLFHMFNDGTRVLLDTICSTIIVLFTGEFLPKTLFKSNPNRMLTFFAPLAYVFYIVLWPISRFATFLSRGLLRMVGIKMDKQKDDGAFTKVDLDYLVQSSIDNARSNEDIEEEVKIFQNALDFSDTKVRDCMVPRTEIIAVEDHCPLDELRQKFTESGKSKVVVFKDDIDHIIGYIHSSDMFRLNQGKLQAASSQGEFLLSESLKTMLREMPFVPETMAAQKLMRIFLQQKKSIGVVVDEFGGTSGIVCLEDIVEEIFGEIEDEHDSAKYIAKQVADDEYLLSARMEIDQVNEMFGLDLPESDDYMTVGGLILHAYQSFPKLNEVVTIGRWDFKIIQKTMTKIELVRLKVNP
jgi:CBS domain containing-hemolysin-like protein